MEPKFNIFIDYSNFTCKHKKLSELCVLWTDSNFVGYCLIKYFNFTTKTTVRSYQLFILIQFWRVYCGPKQSKCTILLI